MTKLPNNNYMYSVRLSSEAYGSWDRIRPRYRATVKQILLVKRQEFDAIPNLVHIAMKRTFSMCV
jgi:hypothetical protein